MDSTPDSPAKTPEGYTTQGGNFWTLITPETWKVLHAVLQVVTATGRIGGLEAEQVRELLDHVNSELRHLQTKSEAPASSGRIRVRVAITTIETPNRAVNTLTTLLVGPVTTGGASLEFEAVDEQTDRRVAAASCFEHGNALADFKGSYTLLGHAKSAITTCLERINSAWRSAGS